MMELKIGFLAFSRSLRSDVDRVVSEILLSVSPVVLALVEALALDLARGGMEDLHRLVAGNRRRLEAMSATLPGVSLPDADSRISVARIRFESAEIAENTRLGLHGRAFSSFRARPSTGREPVPTPTCASRCRGIPRSWTQARGTPRRGRTSSARKTRPRHGTRRPREKA